MLLFKCFLVFLFIGFFSTNGSASLQEEERRASESPLLKVPSSFDWKEASLLKWIDLLLGDQGEKRSFTLLGEDRLGAAMQGVNIAPYRHLLPYTPLVGMFFVEDLSSLQDTEATDIDSELTRLLGQIPEGDAFQIFSYPSILWKEEGGMIYLVAHRSLMEGDRKLSAVDFSQYFQKEQMDLLGTVLTSLQTPQDASDLIQCLRGETSAYLAYFIKHFSSLSPFINPRDFVIQTLLSQTEENPMTQEQLGILAYEKKDFKRALSYFRKAADQGYTAAQYRLGNALFEGKGGEKKEVEARYYFEKAAKNGHESAQYFFAFMCEKGLGGESNLPLAEHYYEYAADQGSINAQYLLALLSQVGHKNLEKARKYFGLAADQEHVGAHYQLALMCRKGEGGAIDLKSARSHFKKAAEKDHFESQNKFALMCVKGEGGDVDFDSALHYFERGVFRGELRAMYNMGSIYLKKGTREDLKRARNYIKRAADLGCWKSQYQLALMYEKGQGGKRSLKEARVSMKKAADLGCVDAKYRVGIMFLRGKGGDKNLIAARVHFEQAADRGHEDAREALKQYVGRVFS